MRVAEPKHFLVEIARKSSKPWLQFFCDERIKYAGKGIFRAVFLVASSFVNERYNANARKTANKQFAPLRKMCLAGQQCSWCFAGCQYNVAYISKNCEGQAGQVDEIWSFTYAKQKNVATC